MPKKRLESSSNNKSSDQQRETSQSSQEKKRTWSPERDATIHTPDTSSREMLNQMARKALNIEESQQITSSPKNPEDTLLLTQQTKTIAKDQTPNQTDNNDEIERKVLRQAYDIQYREDNKDAIKAWHAKYYEDNKETIQAQIAQYKEDNEDVIKAWKAQYYEDNKDTIRPQQAQYYVGNKDAIQAQQAQYRKNNTEYLRNLKTSSKYMNRKLKTEKGLKELRKDYQMYQLGHIELPSYAYNAEQYEKFAKKNHLDQE